MTVEFLVQPLKTIARYFEALQHVDPVNALVLSPKHIKHIVYKAMAGTICMNTLWDCLGYSSRISNLHEQ
jgi:hypothetical protein